MKKRVNYDDLADEYDQRYAGEQRSDTGEALLSLTQDIRPARVLEAGCGTGHWLEEMAGLVPGCFGLDYSSGMLDRAARRPVALTLVQGQAQSLPFAPVTFDLVCCVNAIHHFDAPRRFVEEAYRLLRPGGALAIVGNGPHGRRDHWYVYDYFDGVYERDLDRFPSWQETEAWMAETGFTHITRRVVEHILDERRGRAVLDDPFLKKKSCSQLALLDDENYAAGICHLEAKLARAEAIGEIPVFRSSIELAMACGWK